MLGLIQACGIHGLSAVTQAAQPAGVALRIRADHGPGGDQFEYLKLPLPAQELGEGKLPLAGAADDVVGRLQFQ
jgi:hypothetical protein